MSLIDGALYALPDGTCLQAKRRVGDTWQLCDAAGEPHYAILPFGVRELRADPDAPGFYHTEPCDLTIDDLRLVKP